MKIALIGATGNVGSKILAEALNRGHHVTGIIPNPDKLKPHTRLTAIQGDVNDENGLTKLLFGQEAIISSVRFKLMDPRILVSAVKKAGVNRLLVVGGAGSLDVAPGVQLVDTPDFPAEYKAEALAGRDCLNFLRGEKGLAWTFLCPSAFFGPGQRTAKFRIGKDQVLVDENGQSKISQEDFAIAMIDELEVPHHTRKRCTVGY
jgi:putative NADH-flavin reductase